MRSHAAPCIISQVPWAPCPNTLTPPVCSAPSHLPGRGCPPLSWLHFQLQPERDPVKATSARALFCSEPPGFKMLPISD